MEAAEIEIVLNGEGRRMEAGSTVLDLVAALGRDPRTVAVECNGDLLPRRDYGATRLAAGDRLEVVHFVQGGSGERVGGCGDPSAGVGASAKLSASRLFK
jgi:thiamine biosynthesis protein ThiS